MTTPFAYEFKETLVKIDHLTMNLGGRIILRDIDVEIRNIVRPGMSQGQVVGFLGRSGRGKTTLFRCLAGQIEPTRGRVLVTDKQVPAAHGLMGVVPQYHALFENRTVLGNLLVAGRANGLSKADARDKALSLLERFHVSDKVGDYPAQLSGGQKQRVAIIQQLMCGHTYLLMDEPYASLDPIVKAETSDLIIELSRMDEHNTIVVVTHDVAEAVKVADTLWVLGFESGQDGKPMPGARIVQTHNLIDRGLAWREGVERTPLFAEVVNELIETFKTI